MKLRLSVGSLFKKLSNNPPRALQLQLDNNNAMPLPETEVPGRLQAELMSRGLRMTRQRRTILSVVETAKQHLDASQLLRHARRLDPQIDRVTVYRTLGSAQAARTD